MYIDELCDGTVTVKYIPVHTGHNPSPGEYKFLPLPLSVRETVSLQLSKGIPAKRIIQGKTKVLPLHGFVDAITQHVRAHTTSVAIARRYCHNMCNTSFVCRCAQ